MTLFWEFNSHVQCEVDVLLCLLDPDVTKEEMSCYGNLPLPMASQKTRSPGALESTRTLMVHSESSSSDKHRRLFFFNKQNERHFVNIPGPVSGLIILYRPRVHDRTCAKGNRSQTKAPRAPVLTYSSTTHFITLMGYRRFTPIMVLIAHLTSCARGSLGGFLRAGS